MEPQRLTIYDSHTHLNDDVFYADVAAYLARAAHFGVVKMNMVGSNAKLNARALQLAHDHAALSAVVGWHPEDLAAYDQAAEQTLLNQLADPQVVAVGEIGLDYYWDAVPRDVQQRIFARQLAMARELHLPVVIHCREAVEDTYRILKAAHVAEFGGVMHSFAEGPEWAQRFLDLGMDLSFSGVVTFKQATEVQAAVKVTPLEHLLVETDAPYLTPMPYRGKQNEPAFTYFTVLGLAELLGKEPEELATATYDNAVRLFTRHAKD